MRFDFLQEHQPCYPCQPLGCEAVKPILKWMKLMNIWSEDWSKLTRNCRDCTHGCYPQKSSQSPHTPTMVHLQVCLLRACTNRRMWAFGWSTNAKLLGDRDHHWKAAQARSIALVDIVHEDGSCMVLPPFSPTVSIRFAWATAAAAQYRRIPSVLRYPVGSPNLVKNCFEKKIMQESLPNLDKFMHAFFHPCELRQCSSPISSGQTLLVMRML